jgi:hypothetical protein
MSEDLLGQSDLKMFNRIVEVQECDARKDEQDYYSWLHNNISYFCSLPFQIQFYDHQQAGTYFR